MNDVVTIIREIHNHLAQGDKDRAQSAWNRAHQQMETEFPVHSYEPSQRWKWLAVHRELAETALLLGSRKGAAPYRQTSEKIAGEIPEEERQHRDHREDMCRYYLMAANVFLAQGKEKDAKENYYHARSYARDLCGESPQNLEWNLLLREIYHKIGDFWKSMGDLPKTNYSYTDAAKLSENLMGQYPDDFERKYEHTVDLHKRGDLSRRGKGSTGETMEFYQKALEIRRKLDEENRDNSRWIKGVAGSYYKIWSFAKEQSLDEVERWAGELKGTLEEMKSRGMELGPLARLLDQLGG